jgi:hypothetical protein
MSIFKSVNNPAFAHLDDAGIASLYVETCLLRSALVAKADAGEDIWDTIEELDSRLFCIDDEMCARNLDLPSVK